MDRTTRRMLAGLVALLALLLFTVPASADFTVSYCSSQNTATDFGAMDHEWQSNGWCHDECAKTGNYAFAVIQYRNCWCSNYIPEDQVDIGDCDESCPGFPNEKCGSKDKGLYIYVDVNGEPSGTQGVAKPTSANSDPPSKTTAPTTLETSTAAGTSAAQPQTSVVVITESGRVVTQTVVSTPTSAPILTGNQKKGTNAGAIAGGVVGGVAVIAAVVGGVFFLLRRRRRQQHEEDDGTSGVQRNTSTMSKAGLLRGEKGPQYPPPIATSFKRQSRTMLDNESISPISGSDRRNSRPFIFDQRLNPSAIMFNDNSSRASVGTLDDSRDYARTLNVRNPDPQT